MSIKDTKDSLKMDSTWKKKQRASKGDMVKVSGERDERSRMDFEHGEDNESRQAEMEVLGEGHLSSRLEEVY